MLNGDKVPEVWELFPFWTEQEQSELIVQRIETMLRGMGAREARGNV